MDAKVEVIGPFWPGYRLSVGGFQVPHLSIAPPMNSKQEPVALENDHLNLSCDNRIGIVTTRDELDRWLPFLADCMAVAAGYPCHGAGEKMNPFTRQLTELPELEENKNDKPRLVIVDGDK